MTDYTKPHKLSPNYDILKPRLMYSYESNHCVVQYGDHFIFVSEDTLRVNPENWEKHVNPSSLVEVTYDLQTDGSWLRDKLNTLVTAGEGCIRDIPPPMSTVIVNLLQFDDLPDIKKDELRVALNITSPLGFYPSMLDNDVRCDTPLNDLPYVYRWGVDYYIKREGKWWAKPVAGSSLSFLPPDYMILSQSCVLVPTTYAFRVSLHEALSSCETYDRICGDVRSEDTNALSDLASGYPKSWRHDDEGLLILSDGKPLAPPPRILYSKESRCVIVRGDNEVHLYRASHPGDTLVCEEVGGNTVCEASVGRWVSLNTLVGVMSGSIPDRDFAENLRALKVSYSELAFVVHRLLGVESKHQLGKEKLMVKWEDADALSLSEGCVNDLPYATLSVDNALTIYRHGMWRMELRENDFMLTTATDIPVEDEVLIPLTESQRLALHERLEDQPFFDKVVDDNTPISFSKLIGLVNLGWLKPYIDRGD